MVVGSLLASGRDADVFEDGPGRVLRRYRRGGDTAREVEVMRHVAAHGFPVPQVFSAAGPDLVLERLDGPTALRALADGLITPEAVADHLFDLHQLLHRLPALASPAPGRSVLHLDLHPDNVMLTARGPVLLDWRNADDGPPEHDVALTAVILAQVALDAGHPHAGSARTCLCAFLARTGQLSAASIEAAVVRRTGDPGLTAQERGVLDLAGDLVHTTGRRPAP